MKTYQTLIENKNNINQKEHFEILNDLLYYHNYVKHKGFAMIMKHNQDIIKNNDKTDLLFEDNNNQDSTTNENDNKFLLKFDSQIQKDITEIYNITGRQVNSINKELSGLLSSYKTNLENHIKNQENIVSHLQLKLTTLNIKLDNYQLKLLELDKTITKDIFVNLIIDLKIIRRKIHKNIINNHKTDNFIKYLKSIPNIKRKYIFLNNINNNIINHIINQIGKTLFDIKYTNIKLYNSKKKLRALEQEFNDYKFKVNFHKNHNLSMLIVGASKENGGNLNCIAKIENKNKNKNKEEDYIPVINLYLRIPDYFIDHKNSEIQQRYQNYKNKGIVIQNDSSGKYNRVLISQLDFHKYHNLIKSCIANQNNEYPLTFNFSRKVKKVISNIPKHILEKYKNNNEYKIYPTDKLNWKTKYCKKALQYKKYIEQEKLYYKHLFKNNNDNKIYTMDELNCNNNNFNNDYFLYQVCITIDESKVNKINPMICDNGYIGIDINQNHISVSEIDNNGKLIQTFDLHYQNILFPKNNNDKNNSYSFQQRFNQNNNINSKIYNNINELNHNNHLNKNNNKNIKPLTSNQRDFVMGNISRIITDLAGKTQKTIVIEDIDFTKKKQSLSITKRLNSVSQNKKNKNYNRMLNTFSYNKFKEYLLSQVSSKGLNLIEVNPAYTSLIGFIKYTKKLGLSVHQSASYVTARRGLKLSQLKKQFYEDNKEKIQQIKINNELIEQENLKIKKENKENKKIHEKIENSIFSPKDYIKKEYCYPHIKLNDLLDYEKLNLMQIYSFFIDNIQTNLIIKENKDKNKIDIVLNNKVNQETTDSMASGQNLPYNIFKTIHQGLVEFKSVYYKNKQKNALSSNPHDSADLQKLDTKNQVTH